MRTEDRESAADHVTPACALRKGDRARAAILLATAALALLTLSPLVSDARARQLAGTTCALVGSTVLLSLVIGVPLAMLLARTDVPGRGWALSTLTLLLFWPLYLQTAAWQAGFGLQGWCTHAWGGAPLLAGLPGTIWVHTVAAIPWVVVLVSLGLRRAEPELEELALLDLSAPQVLWQVTLRRALPAVGVAALWVAILTAGEMTVTNIFLVRTYAEEVYTQFAQGLQYEDPPLGLASGILGTAWLLLAGLILAARLSAFGYPQRERELQDFALGRWRTGGTAVVWLALMGLVGLPLGSLIYKAGWSATRISAGWSHGWSLARLGEVLASTPARFGREAGWSLLIAAAATLVALLLAVPLAWWARGTGLRRSLVWLMVAGCLALPGPIVGLGVIELFQLSDWPAVVYLYDRSILPPLLAQLVRALPLATVVLWSAFVTVPAEMIDAGRVDGLSPRALLLRLVLPGHWRALVAAALLAFAAAAGELAATILVVPPGVTTLPIQIFNLIHGGVDDLVAGVCLMLVALYALVALAVLRLLARRQFAEL